MESFENVLSVMSGQTLMELTLPPQDYVIRGLLPMGLSIIGGAPKIGKSWLMLDLCVKVAKGEPLWEMETKRGTTLYLCLEDTLRRLQNRLDCITDTVPPNAFFATVSGTLADDLEAQILQFIRERPDTVLIAIDTFQMIRSNAGEPTYGGDYEEIQKLKRIADSQRVAILLVHHLRKQGDRDPINKLSGTTGITGAVDTVFVLDKSRRREDEATLVCTGRDIEHRELELRFSKEEFVWKLTSDSATDQNVSLPRDMAAVVELMKSIGKFSGGNTEFVEKVSAIAGKELNCRGTKQRMNRWKYTLEDLGVYFDQTDSTPGKVLDVWYVPPSETSQSSQKPGRKISVVFVVCEVEPTVAPVCRFLLWDRVSTPPLL